MAARALEASGVRLVIALLVGSTPPGTVEAAVVERAVVGGPRCPTCRSLLDSGAGDQTLGGEPVASDRSGPIEAVVVYCRWCGVRFAHTPAQSVGLGSRCPFCQPPVRQVDC